MEVFLFLMWFLVCFGLLGFCCCCCSGFCLLVLFSSVGEGDATGMLRGYGYEELGDEQNWGA